MIEARRPAPAFDALVRRLADAARRIGEARAAELSLDRRADPQRWRSAGLLWPLFAKD